MCGICGIINFDQAWVTASSVNKMMRIIKHRGPDDEGLFIDKNIGLGNVRLSIIDLSPDGHQPMFSQDKRYCLVYNGEVYNYLELKDCLRNKYHFFSQTDTEVVLNAFIEWGPNCLHRFNGMFAFAIYDAQKKEIFIARDRFGIKPFYYSRVGSTFIFASEQKALLPFLENIKPNDQAIYEYLIYNRTDQGDYTFFEHVKKLPHGSYGIIKNNQLEIKKWYQLKDSLKEPFKESAEYYYTFKKSIELRLRSDVPVGVCLSGGLDSSSIVSVLLKEFGKTDLKTFSAVYPGNEKADESQFIKLYSHDLPNMFFIQPTAESLTNDLKGFLKCHSEPVATLGPYAQFKVMEMAKKHVGVTLDGQGADEKLAGYSYFFGGYFKQLLLKIRWLKLLSEMAAYLSKYKSVDPLKYFVLYLIPLWLKDPFIRMSHDYINREFYHSCKKESTIRNQLYHPKSLNQSLIQHFEYKLEHLLKWEDHNSMYHSLESRVPFLDHHLVEKTLSLPANAIINKATTKYILRQAMKDVLPENIRTRKDKIGFATPWDDWFRSKQMQKLISGILNSRNFQERRYLNSVRCLNGFKGHLNGKINIAKEIWKWLNLELWFQLYFE